VNHFSTGFSLIMELCCPRRRFWAENEGAEKAVGIDGTQFQFL